MEQSYLEHIATIPELLDHHSRQQPKKTAYRHLSPQNAWEDSSWETLADEVSHLASSLASKGCVPGERVAILAPTSHLWHILFLAVVRLRGAVVGLNPHDANSEISRVLEQSKASVLVVLNEDVLKRLAEEKYGSLKLIVLLEGTKNGRENVCLFSELIDQPAQADQLTKFSPRPEDPVTLIYTSGTCGQPKGIIYTHKQLIAACRAVVDSLPPEMHRGSTVAWLPMANLLQQMINLYVLASGGTICFVEDPRMIMEALPQVNPSVFIGVPRFYEKVHAGIRNRVAKEPLFKRCLVGLALKIAHLHWTYRENERIPPLLLRLAHRLADTLVLSRLRSCMGSKMTCLFTGSAPTPAWLVRFFHAIGLPLFEVYGTSENTVFIAMNRPGAVKPGSVGKPLPYNEIRIAESGEVMVRGPGLFYGYFGEDEDRARFSEDGFLRTGDFGHFDEEGFLFLTGRDSDLIKTSTGRRISLVRIESLLREIPGVDQVAVFGASRPFLVALFVMDLTDLERNLRSLTRDPAVAYRPAESPAIRKYLEQKLEELKDKLPSYAQIGSFSVLPEPFTAEKEELTTNLKMRRHKIEEHYRELIEEMYQQQQNN